MKPILILPPDVMSPEDIQLLRENDLCVVVATDPSAVRFCEPPPSDNYDQITEASLSLSRMVNNSPGQSWSARELAIQWAHYWMNAHPVRERQVERIARISSTKTKKR